MRAPYFMAEETVLIFGRASFPNFGTETINLVNERKLSIFPNWTYPK